MSCETSEDLLTPMHEEATAPADMSQDSNDLFLRNASLFYLKLQGQFLLPASTTQNIVEEMKN